MDLRGDFEIGRLTIVIFLGDLGRIITGEVLSKWTCLNYWIGLCDVKWLGYSMEGNL